MFPEWFESVFLYIVWFWVETLLFSIGYTGILWIMGNIKFVGWTFWRKWLPIARFKLTDEESWFSYCWEKFYPHAFICIIIHKRDPSFFVENAEREIVYEVCFIKWQLALGLVFYLLYAFEYIRLSGPDKATLTGNIFERSAARTEKEWVDNGKPVLFSPRLRSKANA